MRLAPCPSRLLALIGVLVLCFAATFAPAAVAPATSHDEDRIARLAEQISALQSVVDGAKNDVEKRRLEANLEQLKKEHEILSSRRRIEEQQRMLAEDLTASPLDMLREKLRAVDRTAEEGEARIKEINTQRAKVTAERDNLDVQAKALGRDAKQPNTARVAELEEAKFTRNEELRALALQREAAEQEIELAREADRMRGVLKTVETSSKPTLRGLIEGFAKLRDDRKAENQANLLLGNLDQNLKISQSSLELSQLTLAKFDEELALLERQTGGLFRNNPEVDRLLAARRNQKKALVERIPHISAQVDALRRAHLAVAQRRDLTKLDSDGRRDTLEAQKEAYVHKLRWPLGCIAVIIVAYVVIGYVLLPRTRKNESLFLARRLSRYLHILAAVGVVSGFMFDDVSMVAQMFGLVSAALVIAMKDVFTSLAGWVVMMLSGKMRIGDRVEIDSVKGDIIDIELLRTTMLEVNAWLGTDQTTGRVISMPNNFVFTKLVFNYSHGHPFIWNKVDFTMTFNSPAAETEALLMKILEDETRMIFAEARVAASSMRQRYGVEDAVYEPRIRVRVAESGVVYSLFFVMHYRDLSSPRSRLARRVVAELEKRPHIQLAYQTLQLLDDPQTSRKELRPSAIYGAKPPV